MGGKVNGLMGVGEKHERASKRKTNQNKLNMAAVPSSLERLHCNTITVQGSQIIIIKTTLNDKGKKKRTKAKKEKQHGRQYIIQSVIFITSIFLLLFTEQTQLGSPSRMFLVWTGVCVCVCVCGCGGGNICSII